MSNSRRLVALLVAVGALAAAGLVFLGDGSYKIWARFVNAGQLVKGGRVEVAGRKVGSISAIRLTPDGQAEVELSIDDGSVAPLHHGTRAAIRAAGQAGIANRFVDLTPGPASAPELSAGASLPTTQTSGIVNIDALLSSFGPRERSNLQQLIAGSAKVYAGSGSRRFNQMLAKLDPALAEVSGLTHELVTDRAAIERLVRTAGSATTVIASRRQDLRSAVGNTARSLGAVARERRPLADLLARAPGVLRQARGTIANTGAAVTTLRPALRDVPPAAPPLGELLRRTASTLPAARSTTAALNGQLPQLRRSLAGLRPLERPAVRGLRSTAQSMKDSRHIFRGMRFYGTDLFLGLFHGVGGITAGEYDKYGHYVKINFVQNLETIVAGRLAPLLKPKDVDLSPGVIGVRTGLTRRCPGGNVPPAADGSSPWVADKSLCTPAHDTPASVNEP